MLLAFAFIFLEMCLVTSVAMLFSCFSTPILSSIFSLSFYLIGHVSWGLETLINKMPSGFGKILTRGIYLFIPDLENFNFKTEIVHGLPIAPQIFLYATVYGILYTLFVLTVAILVFRRRDFV